MPRFAILALVGEAKDGLPGMVFETSWAGAARFGVLIASTGTEVVGDVLRRFDGVSSEAIAFLYYQSACALFLLVI
jgi:hypothetical protein